MEGPTELSLQEILRKSLGKGDLSPVDFLKQVHDADQSDSMHSAAPENVKLLESEEIRSKFIGTELETDYYSGLSQSQFHYAQILAFKGDLSAAHDNFRRSLASAEGAGIEDSEYIQGTIAYLSGDLESLRTIASSYPEGGRNGIILRNFVLGLEQRGTADYLADYSKPTAL